MDRGRHVQVRGEQHGRARLTTADVIALRADRARGMTFEALGRRYGVARTTASQIVKRERWAHIP
jgi:predicted DNA-binding protein (UPF0251 family)